jgi:ATP-dependent Clp protease ATP-binding subunit ClpB
VGQGHALSTVSDAVRIFRAGLQAPNRPVVSFMFLGSTGVGKVCVFLFHNRLLTIMQTELCNKALGKFLFGDEQRGWINMTHPSIKIAIPFRGSLVLLPGILDSRKMDS